MQFLQIAVCEDDRTDREKLVGLLDTILGDLGKNYHITCFDSGEALLDSEINFGLVFMDIAMAGKNGIETGRQLYRKNQDIKIIFETNFGNYCSEAVNMAHAFAFLEKPVNDRVLRQQVEEFLQQTCREENLLEFHKVSFREHGMLVEKPVMQIASKEILYFEVLKSKKKVRLVTEHNSYEYPDTLKHLETSLSSAGFAISCRGILVNLKNVSRIKGYQVYLKNGETVSLSQKRAVHFKNRLNEYVHQGE